MGGPFAANKNGGSLAREVKLYRVGEKIAKYLFQHCWLGEDPGQGLNYLNIGVLRAGKCTDLIGLPVDNATYIDPA